jgi:hypothetical protein
MLIGLVDQHELRLESEFDGNGLRLSRASRSTPSRSRTDLLYITSPQGWLPWGGVGRVHAIARHCRHHVPHAGT